MRRFALLLSSIVLLPVCAMAQDAPKDEPTPRISPAFGVHYGTPLRISGAVGGLLDMSAHRNDGLILMLEPGQQGNEISAGYFRMLGNLGTGYSLRAALVRTGGEPWNASPHTTYVGIEAHWMLVFGIGGRVGYLRRASRSVSDPNENLASIGLSIGH
jgi:hypothetical protein